MTRAYNDPTPHRTLTIAAWDNYVRLAEAGASDGVLDKAYARYAVAVNKSDPRRENLDNREGSF